MQLRRLNPKKRRPERLLAVAPEVADRENIMVRPQKPLPLAQGRKWVTFAKRNSVIAKWRDIALSRPPMLRTSAWLAAPWAGPPVRLPEDREEPLRRHPPPSSLSEMPKDEARSSWELGARLGLGAPALRSLSDLHKTPIRLPPTAVAEFIGELPRGVEHAGHWPFLG